MTLCMYSNILGKPNEGFHSTKIAGFALNDIIGTIFIAVIISKVFKKPFVKTLIILFIVAELMHYSFCVDTAFMKLISGI